MPAHSHATIAVAATRWVIPSKMVSAYTFQSPRTKNIPRIVPSSAPMTRPCVSPMPRTPLWKMAQVMKKASGIVLAHFPP